MKNILKKVMVVAMLLATGFSMKAQFQPPLIWNYANGYLATNYVLALTTNTQQPTVTGVFDVGNLTNVAALVSFSALQTGGGTVGQLNSNVVIQFQGSLDYSFWNNQGQATNAIWVSDPQLVLTLTLSGTNTFTQTTNVTVGWTNFNMSRWRAIRPYSFASQSTNIGMTNLNLEWFWK